MSRKPLRSAVMFGAWGMALHSFAAAASARRSVIAAAGLAMQLALGAIYGWSVFLAPLQQQFGASRLDVNLTFSIAIGVLGVAAGFGGGLLRRIGPRATGTIAGVLYGLGVFASGFAPSLGWLYLTYGVVGGIGLGFGYIIPLAVLVAWFPDKRGFITGLAVAGFGLGALIVSPLAAAFIPALGVQRMLMLLGLGYFTIVVAAAQFLKAAPEGYAPPGFVPSKNADVSAAAYTLAQALRTPQWPLLWLMLALNITAGAALISVAAPLMQELTAVGPGLAALAVCLIALCNGAGRIAWGALSDRIGRSRSYLALFLIQIAAFAAMPSIDSFWLMLMPVLAIAVCYGGGFAVMPAFAADVFGARNAGTIYGAMLTAFSAGAIVGPMVSAALPFRTALTVIAGMLALAAALPLLFDTLVKRAPTASPLEFNGAVAARSSSPR